MWDSIVDLKAWVCLTFAAVCTAILNFIGLETAAAYLLLQLMVIDYITGVVVAVMHKSKKSKTGALSSSAGMKGIVKKCGILTVIYIFVRIDMVLEIQYTAAMGVCFFIANESISILENLGLLGVPYPPKMVKALEVLVEGEKDGRKKGKRQGG